MWLAADGRARSRRPARDAGAKARQHWWGYPCRLSALSELGESRGVHPRPRLLARGERHRTTHGPRKIRGAGKRAWAKASAHTLRRCSGAISRALPGLTLGTPPLILMARTRDLFSRTYLVRWLTLRATLSPIVASGIRSSRSLSSFARGNRASSASVLADPLLTIGSEQNSPALAPGFPSVAKGGAGANSTTASAS